MEPKENSFSTITSNLAPGSSCSIYFDENGAYFNSSPPKNYKPIRIVSIDNKAIKCVFKDKKEIFVTVKEPDIFDENIGVALCICTKMFGSKTKYMEHVTNIIERPTLLEKKKKKSRI